MTPFLKWVGGKRWLVDEQTFSVPTGFNRYFEPFLGGGAVFFELSPTDAILSDLNARLIETYRSVRNQSTALEALLREHAALHSDDYYYLVRERSYATQLERAAQFLYLNRACFNGIYRENLKGKFNVPRGSKTTIILPSDDFKGWSKRLQRAELLVGDFEATIDRAGEDDFIFADPPYTVRHNKNGFIKYNQKLFSWEDQQRLAASLKRATERGAHFMLTNADHDVVRDLYSNFAQMRSVGRASVVAASADKRSATTELLVTSSDFT